MAGQDAPFADFLGTIEKATNETQKREAFVILAAKGFDESQLAKDLALGAEYKVRFRSSGLVKRGSVDSFFGNLVIEFEHELLKTRAHALDQLRAYVVGAWTEDKGMHRPYLAIATDGANWEVFAPRPAEVSGPIDVSNIILGDPVETWSPSGKNDAPSLRDFLNRLLFRKSLVKPTAQNFARDFGLSSPAFLHGRELLKAKLEELSTDPQLDVLRDAWKASLQIAYGSVETDNDLFAKHTYLAVLARLLVWTALEHRPLKNEEIDHVLSGLYFKDRITNLVEHDFFRWYVIPSGTDATRLWLALSAQLVGYDLAAVKEDVLKPLYEELVDPVTKHELGEFYTPDWLASAVVEHLLSDYQWKNGVPAVLDPSCGSGTFLRVAIELARKKRKAPDTVVLQEILSRVMGIDVHPLAVIIARATYLLAIRDLLPQADGPVTLPVFLANALSLPPLQRDLLDDSIALEIDGQQYSVPLDFVLNGADYDGAIEEALQVAHAYGPSTTLIGEAPASLAARIGSTLNKYSPDLVGTLGQMAQHIATLIRERRNSVYGFLLKNHYRPSMLRHSFDFVVGNPPWLTVGQIATPKYKEAVIRLATETNIASRSAGEQSHTELATVFIGAAVGNFLRPELTSAPSPRIAFVMPRSLFTATHHRNIREGAYKQQFDVAELWDLDSVAPLFNVPSCVLFVAAPASPAPTAIKKGKVFSGHLPAKDVAADVAKKFVTSQDAPFKLSYLGKRSAWMLETSDKGNELPSASKNAYIKAFRQGAILYPQTFLIVATPKPVTKRTGSVRVTTDPQAVENAKKSKDVRINQIVDASNIFLTAAGEHILPFALSPTLWRVLLPTVTDPGKPGFAPVSPDQLRLHGRIHTAEWLSWAEDEWKKVRKEADESVWSERLDTFGQFSSQAAQKKFVVLYTAAGTRPVAAVIDRDALPLPFVARDRTFWTSFDSPEEAHYLCAFLNSDFAADVIVDWMNRGLFGPRDINKRILDVRWPMFDAGNKRHAMLASLGSTLSKQATNAVLQMTVGDAGRQRKWIRAQLSEGILKQANKVAQTISESSD